MTCRTINVPGGGFVIACGRDREVKCKATPGCGRPATLLCDGCDRRLCPFCSVGPRAEIDFCPACFREAWLHWVALGEPSDDRDERRRMFRAWARANPTLFMEKCRPLTAAARSSR